MDELSDHRPVVNDPHVLITQSNGQT